MPHANNCPAVPEYFDPSRPVFHSEPVHHQGMLVQDFPAVCLWAQLQWERKRNDGGEQYLENLESEWQRRNTLARWQAERDLARRG